MSDHPPLQLVSAALIVLVLLALGKWLAGDDEGR